MDEVSIFPCRRQVRTFLADLLLLLVLSATSPVFYLNHEQQQIGLAKSLHLDQADRMLGKTDLGCCSRLDRIKTPIPKTTRNNGAGYQLLRFHTHGKTGPN